MKHAFLANLVFAWMALAAVAQTNTLDEAERFESNGQFKQAAKTLTAAIESNQISAAERKTLGFELERLARIKRDYSLTKEQLFDELHASVTGLARAEFEDWVRRGWFDGREIDGTLYFFSSSVSNLFFRHPELNPRRNPPRDETEHERLVLENVTTIKQAALAAHSPYVLPKTFRVNMRVVADRNAAPDGETIRAWIPIPRRYPFQSGFKLLSSSAPPKSIDGEDSVIRSIYFEQPARKSQPTKFAFEYEYTVHGVRFDLEPNQVQSSDTNDEALKHFTTESPHVVFTPEIKALSAKIVGAETNPMLKAKKIYDWLADNLQYSYALEYSTLTNISDYCRVKGYGDCGQQALLFIALCRYNGVPARWQSGWNLDPLATTIHDWSEIYLAPYGWVPVDPYMGNFAMRYITTLTPAQKLEIRDFYFGGLDQYRMAANSDHSQELNPPKQSVRSDNVDFQRGELECGGKNIYFDKYSYNLQYKTVPASPLP